MVYIRANKTEFSSAVTDFIGTANDNPYDATHDNLEDDTHQDIHQVSHQDSTPSAVILRLIPYFQFVQKRQRLSPLRKHVAAYKK